jgi:hypothetical protein
MKTLTFLLLLAAPMLAHATDIHPGDSLADVQVALGAPKGQAQLGNKLVLDYGRGQVELVDGKVIGSNLISPEEFAAKKAQKKADEAKASQLKAQRIAEGTALKAQKLADPNFTSASPTARLAFWQDFRKHYPEVSCDDEYKFAIAQQQQEQIAEQENAQTPTDWETSIDNAELRAHDQFREPENNDDNYAPPAKPTSMPSTASTTQSAGMTLPPSAAGLTLPPSTTGLTPPPSAWPH